MQELLNELQEVSKIGENPFIKTTVNLIIDMVEDKIKKEKQQIIEAASHGANFDKSPFKNAQDYFNQTYDKP